MLQDAAGTRSALNKQLVDLTQHADRTATSCLKAHAAARGCIRFMRPVTANADIQLHEAEGRGHNDHRRMCDTACPALSETLPASNVSARSRAVPAASLPIQESRSKPKACGAVKHRIRPARHKHTCKANQVDSSCVGLHLANVTVSCRENSRLLVEGEDLWHLDPSISVMVSRLAHA